MKDSYIGNADQVFDTNLERSGKAKAVQAALWLSSFGAPSTTVQDAE